jgi:hypothetical protein
MRLRGERRRFAIYCWAIDWRSVIIPPCPIFAKSQEKRAIS